MKKSGPRKRKRPEKSVIEDVGEFWRKVSTQTKQHFPQIYRGLTKLKWLRK